MTPTIEHKEVRVCPTIWTSLPKFLAINLLIATILMVFFCPRCLLTWEGILSLREDFVFSFLISSVLSFGGDRVEEFFEPRISWIKQPIKRLILTVVTYMLYCFVATFIVAFFITWYYERLNPADIQWGYLVQFTKLPMMIAFIFMAIFTTRSWLLEWKKSATETEKLRTEMLASQYQSLKDQLNPHFLFNSLNVLSNLVYEDADRSAEFILKLSKIYRYVLDVQQEELVSLEKELEFARNYLELQKIRFEENLVFSIKVDASQHFYLPPLSLQLLLENAIKHNEASQENPLFISIDQKDDKLWISNTFQPKSISTESSTGLGLSNIKKRYEILSNQTITVNQMEDEFSVQLPLLKVST